MKEIPKEEIARLKAEGRMADNWNRKDAEMVGVFYKYYIEELLNQLADCEYWKKKHEVIKARCEAAERLLSFASFPTKEDFSEDEEKAFYEWEQVNKIDKLKSQEK